MDKGKLEEQRAIHARVLEALDKLEKSEEWNTLKEIIFNEALVRIERALLSEATKPIVDTQKIYILQGEMKWAKRYCNIKRFADFHKSLLEEINNQLK